MPALRPDIDPDGLLEYSVVFTDRSLNHMSAVFQQVMRDIHGTLCEVYCAHTAVVVPGGGTYAMEAVARQLATGEDVMVIRNGWFSYRWTQIFEAGPFPPPRPFSRPAAPAMPSTRRSRPRRLTRPWPRSKRSNPRWSLPRMWKPHRA